MSHQRKIYLSENGDIWRLCRNEDGRAFVLHEANRPSGGQVTQMEIGDFLKPGRAAREGGQWLTRTGNWTGCGSLDQSAR
jgi:hypothetical protein